MFNLYLNFLKTWICSVMTKTTLLLTATLVFGLFTIMSCQKQDAIQQPPKANSTSVTLARTDGKDYTIPQDTANAWAARFQQLNTTTFGGQMPTTLILPSNGIIQLQTAAAAHGVQLSGIAVHLSVKENGAISAYYTPVGIDGTNIQNYETGTASFDHHTETYDGTSACPGCQ